MSGIWQLFRADLRRATSNVMSVIVLCGLVVIPAVFTWFNVIASWEPFDNTKNLKVAVASVDEGYTSALIPLHINVGSLVESALRANDQMDWVITSKEDAVAGTESGDYYAAMVLPKEFSQRMLTFYTAGSKRTEVEYYTNDKSNPLAPLITSEGADDLTAKINAEFTQELDNVALSIISSLANSLSDPESQVAFSRIATQVGSVSDQLRSAAGTATMFTSLLESTVPLATGTVDLLNAVDTEFSSAEGRAQQGLSASNEVQQAIDNATRALSAAFSASDARLDQLESEINTLFSAMGSQSGASADAINGVAAQVDQLVDKHRQFLASLEALQAELPPEEQPIFDPLINSVNTTINREEQVAQRLRAAAADVTDTNARAQDVRAELIGGIDQARASLARADSTYANDIKPLLDSLMATLVDLGDTFGSLDGDLSFLTQVASDSVTLLETAAEDTTALADALTKSSETFATVHEALATAIDSGDVEKVAAIIGSDPATLAAALAQPIGLETIKVYPIVSFGAGMAPLYTMLSLWIGALLMSVTLRVEAPSQAFDGAPQLKLYQQFLGRYGIFGLLGFLQSTLVFLGNIMLVGLDPVHPFLFMLTGWLTSLVFTFLIYTLVVAFSDAGKALAVFILVVQVGGAGGAYPLPLLPEWFQNISPFLPGTHSIDAIRAAMAGIYQGDYWVSIGWLLLFLVPAALIGLVLRNPLIGFNKKMEGMLASTKLM